MLSVFFLELTSCQKGLGFDLMFDAIFEMNSSYSLAFNDWNSAWISSNTVLSPDILNFFHSLFRLFFSFLNWMLLHGQVMMFFLHCSGMKRLIASFNVSISKETLFSKDKESQAWMYSNVFAVQQILYATQQYCAVNASFLPHYAAIFAVHQTHCCIFTLGMVIQSWFKITWG